MKKILLTLLAALFALNVAAQENANGTCGSNVTWTVYPNYSNYTAKLVISGSGAMSNYSDSEGNKAPWYKQDGFIIWAQVATEIEIGDQITHIGNYCFYNMTSLKTVTFVGNSSCSSIGDNAFYGCTELTTINVPESVTDFGTQVFSGCKKLTNSEHIMIKADPANLDGDTYTVPESVKYIEAGAFEVEECSAMRYLVYEDYTMVGGDIASYNIMNNISITSVPSDLYSKFVDKDGNTSHGNNVNTTKIQFLDNKYKSYTFLHDVSIPSGVAAYTAKAEGDAITLTKIKSGKVKAGEGILLKAEAIGTYTFGNGIGAVDINKNENHLVGVLKETPLDNGDNAYVLKTDQNDKIQKFYKIVSPINIGKFKAYLSAGESQAKTFSIFNDDTTNIEETEQEKEDPINSRTDIYNMSGQKLSTTQKGLNIVNGKIVIK